MPKFTKIPKGGLIALPWAKKEAMLKTLGTRPEAIKLAKEIDDGLNQLRKIDPGLVALSGGGCGGWCS
jgi:phosphopantetheinyl transferase (holo-ACP synthase)